MSLFDIVLVHSDSLLVSFNELLHPFWKEGFSFAHEATSAPLVCLDTQRAQTVRHSKSSCTVLQRFIADTHDYYHLNRRSSLIKPSTIWMCTPCAMLMSDQIGFHPIHLFFSALRRSPHSYTNIRQWISAILTSICSHKTRYDALFHDGAIAEWSVHTSDLVAS